MTIRDFLQETYSVMGKYRQELYLRKKREIISKFLNENRSILSYYNENKKPELCTGGFYGWTVQRERQVIEEFNKMYEYEPIKDPERYRRLLNEEIMKERKKAEQKSQEYETKTGYTYDQTENIRPEVNEILGLLHNVYNATPNSSERKAGCSPEVNGYFNQICSTITRINEKLRQNYTHVEPPKQEYKPSPQKEKKPWEDDDRTYTGNDTIPVIIASILAIAMWGTISFVVVAVAVGACSIIGQCNSDINRGNKILGKYKDTPSKNNNTYSMSKNTYTKKENKQTQNIPWTPTPESDKKVKENWEKGIEELKNNKRNNDKIEENKKKIASSLEELVKISEEHRKKHGTSSFDEFVKKYKEKNEFKEKSNDEFLEKQKEIKEGKYSIDSKERSKGKIIIENDLELSKCFGIDEKGDDELKLDVDTKCVLERYYKNHKLDPMDFSDELKRAGRCIIDYHYNKNDVHMEVDNSCFKRIIERRINDKQKNIKTRRIN